MDPIDSAMQRYLDGDAIAFVQLHDLMAPRLGAFVMRLGASHHEAEDLVQETFLHIHSARATFSRGKRVLPWAFTVARNVYFDERRRRRTHPFDGVASQWIDPASHAATGDNPESLALARQRTLQVARLMATLPGAQRDALLSAALGNTRRATARKQGASEVAVKLRVFRARRVLAGALGD